MHLFTFLKKCIFPPKTLARTTWLLIPLRIAAISLSFRRFKKTRREKGNYRCSCSLFSPCCVCKTKILLSRTNLPLISVFGETVVNAQHLR